MTSLLMLACVFCAGDAPGPALAPPPVIVDPGPAYTSDERAFQGIPGLARAPEGRLWATWYGGGEGEGPDNYVMLVTSGDDGATWSDVMLVVAPEGETRAYDPCLWLDPTGRLWLFWAQACHWWDGRAGVWAITTDEPDKARPAWTEPRRLCDGIMMNKPTVLSTGAWLLPAAVWSLDPRAPEEHTHDLGDKSGSNVIASTDRGKTWRFRGQAQVPERQCDEHMLVERQDGTLWMLVRTRYGIGESFSDDQGKTWTAGTPSPVTHIPHARFFIRRLASGSLLLVKHNPPDGKTRSHLTAYLSKDDGKTWQGGLVLDERRGVSYPDGVQGPGGTLYIIYDFDRRGARKILMATFTEEDILAGNPVSERARMRVLVNQAKGGG